MEYRIEQEELYSLIAPVVIGMGFSIVDLGSRIVQGQLHINLVLYNSGGISIDDCAAVYRTVIPRIEMSQENRNVHLEVGSPGLSRNIKSADEFRIFKGRGVRILLENEDEWISGIIDSAEADELRLLVKENSGNQSLEAKISIMNIRKAKLDDTQEIGR